MKQAIIVLFVLACVLAVAYAYPAETEEQGAGEVVEGLREKRSPQYGYGGYGRGYSGYGRGYGGYGNYGRGYGGYGNYGRGYGGYGGYGGRGYGGYPGYGYGGYYRG